MNIYDIKRLVNRHDTNNPYFFKRKSMKFFGQTLKDFKIRKLEDGKRVIYARIHGRTESMSVRVFDPETNSLEFALNSKGKIVSNYIDLRSYLIINGGNLP